jgi:thiol-disulfide isomerase/thioredoxin
MKITKIGLLKISILTATMLVNTGCLFGLFENEPKTQYIEATTSTQKIYSAPESTVIQRTTYEEPTSFEKSTSFEQPTSVQKATSFEQPTSIQTISPATTIPTECTDDPSSINGCHKKLISPKEIKIKKSNGAVHQLRSIQGKKITIIERPTGYLFPQFKNKIVILEMFGHNCSHCIKEMATLNRLRRKYRHNLEIVALQVEGRMSKNQANRLIRRHQIHYPIIPGQTATELQYQVQTTYGWTGILPFIMVIKDGVTEFTYRGEVNYNRIDKDIRSLLR